MRSVTLISKNDRKIRSSTIQSCSITKKSKMKGKINFKQQYISNLQLISKIRIKTIEAQKIKDRDKVHSSLNILTAPTSVRSARTLQKKSLTQKKIFNKVNPKIFNNQPTKQVNLFANITSDQNDQKNPNIFIKTRSLNRYSSIKILSELKNQKNITIVISADFIINQFNLWNQQPVQEISFRVWNKLQPYANIIWLIHSQNTVKKIQYYTKTYNLSLDGIIKIQPNKREPLIISYFNFQQEMKFKKTDKLLIINSIEALNIRDMKSYEFKNSLPLVSHRSTFVHFIKINVNDRNRMKYIPKILNEELPRTFNLTPILEDYYARKYLYIDPNYQQQKVDQQLQVQNKAKQELLRAKNNLLVYFQQSYGLTTRFQQNSLYFIIGDALKRNFSISKAIQSYHYQYGISKKRKEQISPLKYRKNKLKQQLYNRSVFLWEF